MGRHVNADAGSDEGDAADVAADAETMDAESTPHEHARHVAEPGLLEPQAVISPDTHVGVDLDAAVTDADPVAPSPANPNALIEHGLVGDGHEME